MEINVFWTETALNNIEEIFEYYQYKASEKVAKKIVKKIVNATINIQSSPLLGKKEEILKERNNEYRVLISGNYKIIYWIENKYIKIAAVFDSRQNPDKLENIH